MARAQGWYEPDDEVDAALPYLCRDLGWDDRAWKANEHSFGLLLGVLAPGPARARGRCGEVLGRAARDRGRLHVRRHRHPRRPEDRPRARRLLRGQQAGPVPPRAGGRREPAVRGRVVRRHVLRRDAPPRARPAAHGRARWPRDAPRRSRARAERGNARGATGRAMRPIRPRSATYGINEHVHTLVRVPVGVRPRGARRAPDRAGRRVRGDGGPADRRALLRIPGVGRSAATWFTQTCYGYQGASLVARRAGWRR